MSSKPLKRVSQDARRGSSRLIVARPLFCWRSVSPHDLLAVSQSSMVAAALMPLQSDWLIAWSTMILASRTPEVPLLLSKSLSCRSCRDMGATLHAES